MSQCLIPSSSVYRSQHCANTLNKQYQGQVKTIACQCHAIKGGVSCCSCCLNIKLSNNSTSICSYRFNCSGQFFHSNAAVWQTPQFQTMTINCTASAQSDMLPVLPLSINNKLLLHNLLCIQSAPAHKGCLAQAGLIDIMPKPTAMTQSSVHST